MPRLEEPELRRLERKIEQGEGLTQGEARSLLREARGLPQQGQDPVTRYRTFFAAIRKAEAKFRGADSRTRSMEEIDEAVAQVRAALVAFDG